MALSGAVTVLLFCLVLCTQTLGQRPPRGRCRNMERRLAALEAKCDYSKEEQQAARLVAKMEAKIQTKLEAMQDGMQRLEALLQAVEVKVSAPDKRLQDNDLTVDSRHNASVLAMEGVMNSGPELVAALEQSFRSMLRNATEILASMMSSSEAHVLARADNKAAVFNASIARVEQTTKELATRVSAMEVEVQSVTERIAASEQSLKFTIRNAKETLAATLNVTKAQLLAKAESNAAMLNGSIARVEQTTKELATRVSAIEDKLDDATSLQAEEIEKTRTSCEAIQKRITDVKNHTTEVNGPVRYIRSCQSYYEEGQRTSGVYRLQLHDGQGPMEVFCDMSKGAGWVVFQRRQDGSVDFFRNWTSYEEGFGDLLREFWLGNKNIHRLTSSGLTQLRVDLQAWDGSTAYAIYSHFSVGNTNSSYNLSVSGYSGTAGDSLAVHSGQKFSTFDRDQDTNSGNCAQEWKGAWWYYSGCHLSNLNGLYGTRGSSGWQYVMWYHWLRDQSLQRTELKLK